ncbi:hypothetical protein NEFER03_2058 [Nematocida sp. LUAm3]|nr:hypothetical protein NEFER03_2058 [Nematocida sp. LUAm3]KAI5176224.1 hypothetical protein NEFER02_2030 [Nematocida sp. LUAm2]KAI5179212.1 hypothetical protein NEFER01_2069 [Nematocida sp. LUAm1]
MNKYKLTEIFIITIALLELLFITKATENALNRSYTNPASSKNMPSKTNGKPKALSTIYEEEPPLQKSEDRGRKIHQYCKDINLFIRLKHSPTSELTGCLIEHITIQNDRYILNLYKEHSVYIWLPLYEKKNKDQIRAIENILIELLLGTLEINARFINIIGNNASASPEGAADLSIIYLIVSKLKGCEYIGFGDIPKIISCKKYLNSIPLKKTPMISNQTKNIVVGIDCEVYKDVLPAIMEDIVFLFIGHIKEIKVTIPRKKEDMDWVISYIEMSKLKNTEGLNKKIFSVCNPNPIRQKSRNK